MASASGLPEETMTPSTSRPRLVSKGPAADFVDQIGQRLRRDGILADAEVLLAQPPEHVLLDPVAGRLAVAARLGQRDDIIHQRPALAHQHVAIVGGDAVSPLRAASAARRAVRRVKSGSAPSPPR